MATDEVGAAEDDEQPGFETFYRQRWHQTARWAAVLCGDIHRGEEAAQEAFLRIASRYDDLDQPEAYLRRALINILNDTHRSSARRNRREQHTARLHVTSDRPIDEFPDPELFAALDALPPRQRAVLVLRYWADWDEATIADALDCRSATVRSLAKRGLDRLRARLEEHT